MRTYCYFIKTGENTRFNGIDTEWDGDDGYDFEYDVDDRQLKEGLVSILCEDENLFTGYDSTTVKRKIIESFVEKIDEVGELDNWADYYEEELKEYFKDDAIWEATA